MNVLIPAISCRVYSHQAGLTDGGDAYSRLLGLVYIGQHDHLDPNDIETVLSSTESANVLFIVVTI